MAVQEQLERLKRSSIEWNQWRQQQPHLLPDLSNADLRGANLILCDLSRADLKGTDLTSAILGKSNLSGANLRWTCLNLAILMDANLNGVNLTDASLVESNLSDANLTDANLSRANLKGAFLNRTDLTDTNLSKAHFSHTTFVEVDLSTVKGLETAIHDGPSTVNINSVIFPHDEHICLHFLRGVGFSNTFIDYLPSLLSIPIQYHSLFLSYSHYDQAFTKRLYGDLQNQGVRCWFAPHDLQPGTPMVRGIEEAIHLHEKLLLVLSVDAVNSAWVQQEVEAALYKEVTTGQEILFPIRLDNTVLESETLWAKRLRQRHIGDFTGWRDSTAYQQAFTTLLRHLKVSR